ncbi:MAG: SCO family protein [Phycisphaerae bacterium]|nr:SCO family protein [Phycisphaerae bacterium]
MTARPMMVFTIPLLALLLLGVMVVSWFGMNRRAPSDEARLPAEPDPLASLVLPDFTLVDQEGRPHTRDLFKGQWTVLAFTFAHCTTVCPIMHSHLIRLQSEMKGTPLKIVTISVDPAHDTPDSMRAYAERIGADTERWTFLTGDAATIGRILAGLRFSADPDPSVSISLPGGATMNNILHPSKVLLIGPDGTVRALENGLEWSGASALLRRVRGQTR